MVHRAISHQSFFKVLQLLQMSASVGTKRPLVYSPNLTASDYGQHASTVRHSSSITPFNDNHERKPEYEAHAGDSIKRQRLVEEHASDSKSNLRYPSSSSPRSSLLSSKPHIDDREVPDFKPRPRPRPPGYICHRCNTFGHHISEV